MQHLLISHQKKTSRSFLKFLEAPPYLNSRHHTSVVLVNNRGSVSLMIRGERARLKGKH